MVPNAPEPPPLSRRERQILDIVYARANATAGEIKALMSNPPSDSAVRSSLRILEEKGHVKHKQDGARYVYLPTVPRKRASRSALRHLLHTFFDDSAEDVMAALLEVRSPDEDELARMRELIDRMRREEKDR